MSEISRNSNRIMVEGDLRDFHYLLAQIHRCIEVAGYSDVILDMSACASAFQNSMLSVCAKVAAYRKSGVTFSLIPPRVSTLSNLFKNTIGHTSSIRFSSISLISEGTRELLPRSISRRRSKGLLLTESLTSCSAPCLTSNELTLLHLSGQ